MLFDTSYAFYGINKEGEKQGFQIYQNWGFVEDIDKIQRFKLFQTPTEIVLQEDGDNIFSIFLISSDRQNLLFINHHWFTGISQGNRNCYDGFSMILKYSNWIPNIFELVNEFFKNESKVRFENYQFSEEKTNLTLNTNDCFSLSKHIINSKRKTLEFFPNEISQSELIQKVLDSLADRNSDKSYIYFTTCRSLFNRIQTMSIDKIDFSKSKENSSNNFVHQIEDKYQQVISEKSEIINKREVDLNILKNTISEKENYLEELSVKLSLNIQELKNKNYELDEINNSLRNQRQRNEKVKRIVRRNILVGRYLYLLYIFFLIIFSAFLVILALAAYIILMWLNGSFK